MDKRDFFISYTQEDKAWALWINDALKRHGYSTHFQAQDSTPGVDFVSFMQKALENLEGFIAVWSRAYQESAYCEGELHAAYAVQNVRRDCKFIIVRVSEHDIPKLYKPLVRLDIFEYDNEADALRQLMDAVGYKSELIQHIQFPNPCLSIGISNMADALFDLGMLYLDDSFVVQNKYRACQYLKWASDFHHAEASRRMGEFYEDGLINDQSSGTSGSVPYIIPVNNEIALDYYRCAARYGDKEALNKIGEFYRTGRGDGEPDFNLACKLFKRANKNGSIKAGVNLADIYLHGPPKLRNKQEAWKLLDAAISMGDEDAERYMDELLADDFYYFSDNPSYSCGSKLCGVIQKHIENNVYILKVEAEDEIRFIRVKVQSKRPRLTRQHSPSDSIQAKIQDYNDNDDEPPVIILEALL